MQPQLLLTESIIASNGAAGIILNGRGTLGAFATSVFNNGMHGIIDRRTGGRLAIDTVIVGSNAKAGVNVEPPTVRQL